MSKNQHINLQDKYQKKTQLEHILDLPDTYIGSVEKSEIDIWVYENDIMIKKKLEIVNGLYKIFDEILVNACDHYTRMLNSNNTKDKVTTIKVNINKDKNEIQIYNDGKGIPIALHPEYNIYIPEMIFSNLLTSSNYNKDEKKIVGGKNGYGAKLANIYSTKFIIETVDEITKKKYIQEFSNNMKNKTNPEITSAFGIKSYTLITFYPDLQRFNMKELEDDIILIMKKRVYDLTACTDKSVSIYLNNIKLDIKQFDKYVDLYLTNNNKKVYEYIDERWEIAVALSNDEDFEQVSFVNGIYTYKGGKHVEFVATHIANKLQKLLANRARNKINLKVEHIKKNMFLFLKCSIENPSFDSQTKEYLTTVTKNFGSKFNVSDKFIEKLSKTDLVERSIALGQHKDDIGLAKKEVISRNVRLNIPKLDDAELAGTKRSNECTLILTEGDSAKSLAVAGLSIIGREKYGVFPLKGKLLNVREATKDQLLKNQEIINIKKILGLRQFEVNNATSSGNIKKIYTDTNQLRYGHIMIMTDADVDGYHIKGLLINFIDTFWSNLLEVPNFIMSFITPIIKVTKNKEIISFYTLNEYKLWKEKCGDEISKWSIKYYKGLGTSTDSEAKEYFKKIEQNTITYNFNNENCKEAILLGFAKNKAEQRKQWLREYDDNNILEYSQKNVSFGEFINKELIHFSRYDCQRSIPSICDGLKPSQRKILYGVFKKNIKNEVKVSQLAGTISEICSYHHGEVSLHETIIGMAQNYVGSNNINLLKPNGQFGSRLLLGKDAASPRYIFTCLEPITNVLFNKKDEPIYEYLDDDGIPIEPRWFLPTLPLILINGSVGIGTGYSTNIPSFNPDDIIENMKRLNNNVEIKKMIPWYKGFNGTIVYNQDNDYFECRGTYKFINDTTIEITEIPIGIGISNYEEKIDEMIIDKSISDEKIRKKQCINDNIRDTYRHNNKNIHLTIKMPKETLENYKNNIEQFEKDFDLIKMIRTSNMYLYNSKGVITKYESAEEILTEFYEIKLDFNLKRKNYWLSKLKHNESIIASKIKFLEYVREEKIDIRKTEEEIIILLEKDNFPKFNLKDDENNENISYNYLLSMPIRNLTQKYLDKMKEDLNNLLNEYSILEKNTVKDILCNDIDDFYKIYQNFNDIQNEQIVENLDKMKNKTKKIKISKKNI